MKKTYINPELEVVKIATSGILAASSRELLDDIADVTGSGEDAEYTNTLSRESNFDFDNF